MATLYCICDVPANGTAGQECGTFLFEDLPDRIKAAVSASPDADMWSIPALSDGDHGEELADLFTVVTRVPVTVSYRWEAGPTVEYRRHPYHPTVLHLECRALREDGTPHDERWFRVTDSHLLNLQRAGGSHIVKSLSR